MVLMYLMEVGVSVYLNPEVVELEVSVQHLHVHPPSF
jgi:hypothetical protein